MNCTELITTGCIVNTGSLTLQVDQASNLLVVLTAGLARSDGVVTQLQRQTRLVEDMVKLTEAISRKKQP